MERLGPVSEPLQTAGQEIDAKQFAAAERRADSLLEAATPRLPKVRGAGAVRGGHLRFRAAQNWAELFTQLTAGCCNLR